MKIERIARGILVAGCLGLALTLAIGCTSDQDKLAQNLAEAQEYRAAGKYEEAFLLLRQALKLQPKDASINLQLAEVLSEMGRPQDAGFYYGEAYRLDPSLTEAALTLVPLLYGSELERAGSLLEEVLAQEPGNFRAHLRKAEVALLNGDTATALASALTAVELAPEEPGSHRIVGTVYSAMAKEQRLRQQKPDPATYESALTAFRRANALDDGSWLDHNAIAELYGIWPGHDADAEQAWKDAFAEAQKDEDEIGMRTVVRTAMGWATQRRRNELLHWAVERGVEVDPDRVISRRQLAALAEREEAGAGERVWREAIAETPGEPLFHVGFGRYLANHGRQDEAVVYLEGLSDDVPDSAEKDLLLVELHAAREDGEAARAVLAHMREQHASDLRSEFAAARLAVAEGRLDEATKSLRSLAEGLERPDVMRLLAHVEHVRGENRRALAAIDRAMELVPLPDRGLYEQKHAILRSLGDWEGIVESLRAMNAARMPWYLEDVLNLIEANYSLGRREAGRRRLEQLLKVDPPPLAAVLLFVRYEGRGDPARAIALLETVQKQNPKNGVVARSLAAVEQAAGRPERALARLDILGPPAEQVIKVRLQRAQILAQLQRWSEAEVEARAAFASQPRPLAAAGVLAEVLRAQGRQPEAITLLDESRAAGTLTAQELWLLGNLLLAEEELARAQAPLEAALAANPDLQMARNDLAYVLAETGGDLNRALELAREARSALPESPAVADTLGWVYYRRGLMEPALAEFRTASELASRHGVSSLEAEIHYHLGMALQALGRTEEAVRELDHALALEPRHERAREARSKIVAAAPAS